LETLYLDMSTYCTGYLICDFMTNKPAQVQEVNKIQVPWERRGSALNRRIIFLYKKIARILKQYPNIVRVCWEDQFVGAKGNARIGMELSQLRGALVPLLIKRGIKIEDAINNQTVKKHLTGYGNCKKIDTYGPIRKIALANIEYFTEPTRDILHQEYCDGINKKNYYKKNDDIFDAIGLWIYDCQLR